MKVRYNGVQDNECFKTRIAWKVQGTGQKVRDNESSR